jgi:hypothetical protein
MVAAGGQQWPARRHFRVLADLGLFRIEKRRNPDPNTSYP